MQERFDVIYRSKERSGVMAVFATDRAAAMLAARDEFPDCRITLVPRPCTDSRGPL